MALVLQGYYDGSGGEDTGRITLAGYIASVEVWGKFEPLWWEILRNFEIPCNYLHMKEAYHCRGEFSKDKGWNKDKVQSLLARLKHCFLPLGWLGEDGPSLIGTYCTVDLEDFDRACKDLPFLKRKGAKTICAEILTGIALMRIPLDPDRSLGRRDGTISLTFDPNEKFFPVIDRAWRRALKRPEGKRGPLGMITSISSADGGARELAALQAADYLAWHVNRWLTKECNAAYWRANLAGGPVHGVITNYEKLMRWYGKGEMGLFSG